MCVDDVPKRDYLEENGGGGSGGGGTDVIGSRSDSVMGVKVVYSSWHDRPCVVARDECLPPTLYLTRHGESEFNVEGKIGGDSPLAPRGKEYADVMGKYFNALDLPNLRIVTSSLVRTISTAATTKASHRSANPTLDEIKAGAFDGLTYEEIERLHPREFELREKDKLRYRYPEGESYLDCYHRISTVLADIKATPSPVLIVAHQAILRCMVGSITDRPPDVVPYIDIPQHKLIRVTRSQSSSGVLIEHLQIMPKDEFRDTASDELKNS